MKSVKEISADYHLFIDIQMGKYLESVNKSEFSDDLEAKLVLNKIMKTYNEKVAFDHLRLDNLNKPAKTAWFNSIEIDFGKETDKEIDEFDEMFDDDYLDDVEFDDKYNLDIFPFLPENSISILIFIGPALKAYGLPLERFKDLIGGEPTTEIEEYIITWAFNLTVFVMGSIFEDSPAKRKKCFEDAIEIACEELDREKAVDAAKEIKKNVAELVGISKHKKKKKKK